MHTVRRVASTPSAVLSRGGTWPGGTPSLAGVYRIPAWRVPHPGASPVLTWPGGIPSLAGGTLSWGIPLGKDLGPETGKKPETGVPPHPVNGHTPVKTLPSRILLEMRAIKIDTHTQSMTNRHVKFSLDISVTLLPPAYVVRRER